MYYPKSQIKLGLNTDGGEYVTAEGADYIGPYWITSTGRSFSGLSPTDPSSEELFTQQSEPTPSTIALTILNPTGPSQVSSINAVLNQTYAQLKQISTNPQDVAQHPAPSVNPPTNQDYTIGEFRRFFCKKVNADLYLEIDEAVYTKLINKDKQLLWELYTAFEMPWTLVGSREQVYRTNKNITELAAKRNNAINLAQFLKNDYLKYYKG